MTDPVAEGYDAVYAAWRSAGTFHEIWAQHAVDGRVAPGFEHISFSPVEELAGCGWRGGRALPWSEMGADAMSALELEMALTLEIEPYRGHVFASARRS
jgi:hypothetical protein